MNRLTKLLGCFTLAVCLILSACNNDDDTPATMIDDDGGGPLFVIASTLISGPTTFINTTRSLERGTNLSISDSSTIILDYQADILEGIEENVFYTTSREAPEITKWRVTDAGIVQEDVVSFLNFGLTFTFNTNKVVSETRAYYLDLFGSRLIVWNPSTMETVGEISFGLAPEDGHILVYPTFLITPDNNTMVISASWINPVNFTNLDRVGVLEINLTTEEVTFFEDTRTRHIQMINETPNGEIFHSAGDLWAGVRTLGEEFGSPSTVLRSLPGRGEFDPDFSLDLTTLTGGRPAGHYFQVSDNRAYMKVFYEERAGDFNGDIFQYIVGEKYKWWTWEIGSDAATEIPNQPYSNSGIQNYFLDGRRFISTTNNDFTTSILTELSQSGELVPTVTVIGIIAGVAQVGE